MLNIREEGVCFGAVSSPQRERERENWRQVSQIVLYTMNFLVWPLNSCVAELCLCPLEQGSLN